MESNISDSRQHLLESNQQLEEHVSCGQVVKNAARKCCRVKTLKKRVPILDWLPKYKSAYVIQDIIAGITVGLTAIPQSIAYAIIAGLEPQYGLYSAFLGAYVYLFFGSCKDVTIGPTAILSALVAKYVKDYGPDFAVLAAFLSGAIIFILGFFHLGFLVDFISNPVISGFTTAAALQIASAQLRTFFAIGGSSGDTFIDSLMNLVKNIGTARLWDTLLSIATVVMLVLLKHLGKYSSRTSVSGFSTCKNILWKMNWFISMSRNAVVVVFGIILAYCFKHYNNVEPFVLTGQIKGGLPNFQPPPFSTVVGNQTYTFPDMLNSFGPQAVVVPLISILESIAIAKAFAKGKSLDATQEMIALGLCNIVGSFIRSMPITGSFTRTAVNYASGVQTQAGGIFKGIVVILALSLLTDTFYYIPRASLAALIITAMFYMVDFGIILTLWKTRKPEMFVLLVTMVACLSVGLEYGICAGIITDAIILLYRNARVPIHVTTIKVNNTEAVVVSAMGPLLYCSAENISYRLQKLSKRVNIVVIEGTHLTTIDTTVIKSISVILDDMTKQNRKMYLWNFPLSIREMWMKLSPSPSNVRFINGDLLEQLRVNETIEITATMDNV